jgi:Holliday junction resolvase-like predicted endonuclease
MDRYEEAVMHYLTANGATFVVHQYSISQGWACPDFIAIRPCDQIVCIVEVSTAWDLGDLAQRVKTRQVQWWDQLVPHLQQHGGISHSWDQRMAVFIRQDRVAWFQQAIGNAPNVSVIPLEPILAAWNWPPAVWTPQFNPL